MHEGPNRATDADALAADTNRHEVRARGVQLRLLPQRRSHPHVEHRPAGSEGAQSPARLRPLHSAAEQRTAEGEAGAGEAGGVEQEAVLDGLLGRRDTQASRAERAGHRTGDVGEILDSLSGIGGVLGDGVHRHEHAQTTLVDRVIEARSEALRRLGDRLAHNRDLLLDESARAQRAAGTGGLGELVGVDDAVVEGGLEGHRVARLVPEQPVTDVLLRILREGGAVHLLDGATIVVGRAQARGVRKVVPQGAEQLQGGRPEVEGGLREPGDGGRLRDDLQVSPHAATPVGLQGREVVGGQRQPREAARTGRCRSSADAFARVGVLDRERPLGAGDVHLDGLASLADAPLLRRQDVLRLLAQEAQLTDIARDARLVDGVDHLPHLRRHRRQLLAGPKDDGLRAGHHAPAGHGVGRVLRDAPSNRDTVPCETGGLPVARTDRRPRLEGAPPHQRHPVRLHGNAPRCFDVELEGTIVVLHVA